MLFRQTIRWCRGRDGPTVALVVAAALLLAPVVAAHHHDCPAEDDGACVVCWYVAARICLPEASSPPPMPTITQRLVPFPSVQPNKRPLVSAVARGPPFQLL